MQVDPAISAALAISLAALFAASAAHKARGFQEFIGVISNYRIAPDALVPLISPIVIAMEAAIAAGLILPQTRGVAALGAALLLSAYGSLIAFNLARGWRDIDCGCSFGGTGERLTPTLVYRNAALAICALAAAAPIGTRALGIFDFASIGLFAIASAALYGVFESLRANAARFHAAGHI